MEKFLNYLIAIGIVAAFYIVSPLFSYVIVKIFNLRENKKNIKNKAFYLPLKSIFKVLGFYIAVMYLHYIYKFNDNVIYWIQKGFKIVIILAFARGLAKSINPKSHFLKRFKEKTDKEIDDTSIIFVIRFVKVLIYIIAAFMIFADLGYDLSGIVTGLGLGSVVITLAAQDTIKNLFGGLIIFLDKPFRVGDYIEFGNYSGTVEDITFRSTKIRTIQNSIAQVPNSELASTTVVNLSKIQKRRYELDLGIVLSTDLDKMKSLERKILDYLNSDPIVIKDSANACFKEVRQSDYQIYVYCYLNLVNFVEFLKEKERINYAIMKILQNNNIEMAYDTKTIEIMK